MPTDHEPDARLVRAHLADPTLGFSPNTLRAYGRGLDDLVVWLAGHYVTIRTASTALVQAFIDDGDGPKAAQRSAAVKRLLGWPDAHDIDHAIDVEQLRAAASSRSEPRDEFLDESAMRALEHARWTGSTRDRVLVLVILDGGASVQEAAALRWSDVAENGTEVTVGKGRRRRANPAGVTLRDAVRCHARATGRIGPLLESHLGAAITTRSVHNIVKAAGDAIGLDDLGPARLRASGLRRQYDAGASIVELQRWGGYSQPSPLRRALTEMSAVSAPCAACRGAIDTGRRCAACAGTGVIVAPPARYVLHLDPSRLLARV